MSITAYTGLPGSGKSYEVVNGPILKAIEEGREVWTNIPTNIPGVIFHETVHAELRVDRKPEGGIEVVPVGHWYLDAPPGSLCVVDECWRYWPAGMKADRIPQAIKSWFAEHRHRTDEGRESDIVLVTQDLAQVARFARDLIDQTFRMRKLNAVGWRNGYRVDVYRGAVTGHRPPEAQFIAGQIRKYSKEGFARYRSHTKGQEAKGVVVDNRGSAWRRPAVAILPLVLVALLFAGPALRHLFGADKATPPHEAARSASVATAAPAPVPERKPDDQPPKPAPKAETNVSPEWTLLGIVTRQDGSGRALLRSPTGRRVVDVRRCREAVEWVCDIDGKLVAQWTGNGLLARAQGQTYNKANGS